MDTKQALQYLFGNKCFILQIGGMKFSGQISFPRLYDAEINLVIETTAS